MKRRRQILLGVAVRIGHIGYVLTIGGELKSWLVSRKAGRSNKMSKQVLGSWITKFDPDFLVLENHQTARRKSDRTKARLQSLCRVARHSGAEVFKIDREQRYPNKYVEAIDLAERFPILKNYVPKVPRIWEKEPRDLVYFEALALSVQSGLLGDD